MREKKLVTILGIMTLLSFVFYLTTWAAQVYLKYPALLSREVFIDVAMDKGRSLMVIVVAVALTAVSSLVFQTVSESRILTPNVLGIDSLFIAIQTVIVLVLGTDSIFFKNSYVNFIVTSVIMCSVSMLLLKGVMKKGKDNMYILLMVGMIFGILMTNLSSFFQVVMSPGNFDAVQSSTSSSIKNVNLKIFYVTVPIFFFIIAALWRKRRIYDVMSLGKNHASSLGVNYKKEMNYALLAVTGAVSLSTALIGPFSFLGLLAVNTAREITKSYKHGTLIVVSALIGIIFVVAGQVLVEEFVLIPNLQSVINLIGGIYILKMILKEGKSC